MLKVELHSHTSDDPNDYISHTAHELIDCAAALGYDALAITLHDRWQDPTRLMGHAQARDIVLMSGIERTIDGKHVLLINFGKDAEAVQSFDSLARLRTREPGGLVIAPHAFYPGGTCLGQVLERHVDLFDAIEFNAFYTAQLNWFNNAALAWSKRHGKPLVGNADVHRLHQLGKTYSLVDAAPDPLAICRAIKAGRVEIQTAPLGLKEAVLHLCDLLCSEFATPSRADDTTACQVD